MELPEDTEIDFADNTSISIRSEEELLSYSNAHLIEVVSHVIICTLVSGFGIISNIINLVVFLKQGLNTTINIGFFALAVSDLSSLILQLWISICFNPLFEEADILIGPSEIQFVAGIPRVCCARITFLITVYITAERCLCVVFPLHVKQMITPIRTSIIICAIYILTICCSLPKCFTYNIGWKCYPERNKTLLGHELTKNIAIDRVVYSIASILGIISFVAVVVLTAILIGTLQQKNNWRNMTNVNTKQSVSISSRDRKTINLVVMISGILIMSYIPSVLLCMAAFFEPGLEAAGRYSNLFFALWSIVFVFETINSSVNIFVYFKMSSKYRDTFLELFHSCGRFRDKEVPHSDTL